MSELPFEDEAFLSRIRVNVLRNSARMHIDNGPDFLQKFVDEAIAINALVRGGFKTLPGVSNLTKENYRDLTTKTRDFARVRHALHKKFALFDNALFETQDLLYGVQSDPEQKPRDHFQIMRTFAKLIKKYDGSVPDNELYANAALSWLRLIRDQPYGAAQKSATVAYLRKLATRSADAGFFHFALEGLGEESKAFLPSRRLAAVVTGDGASMQRPAPIAQARL